MRPTPTIPLRSMPSPRAPTPLRNQNHDNAQAAAALLQVRDRPIVSAEAKRAIDLYLAQDSSVQDVPEENLAVAAPEAAAFESHMQGLIDMLDKLKAKFEDERTALEKQEGESKHAFGMLSMDLTNQLEAAREDRASKAEKKATALQSAADSRVDLADTTTTNEDDMKYVSDLTANCELKSAAFADRQILRQEEIEAITKAKEIMSSGAVAGEKHLPQLLQNSPSLAQLRAVETSPNTQLR